jgi:hypothetical protein
MAVSTVSFTLVYVSWLLNRIRLQHMIDEVAQLKTRLWRACRELLQMVITPYLSVLFSILAQTQIDDPNRFNQYLLLAYAVMWIVAWPIC